MATKYRATPVQVVLSSWAMIVFVIKILVVLLTMLGFASTCRADERRESKLFRALGWAHFSLQAGDVVSTEMFLDAGYREANPLMRSRTVRLTAKPAIGVLANYGTARLYREHPKLAVALRVGMCVGYGYVVAHNLRLAGAAR